MNRVMRYEEINHNEFGKSLYADNGIVEAIIPLEYGIRIIHFSFVNGKNVFYVQPKTSTEFSTENGWRLYGGHRFWLAPEQDDTYTPDNEPVSYSVLDGQITVSQAIESSTGLQKSISLTFLEDSSVVLNHIIKNCGNKTITRSIWGVSSMAPGGTEYIPLGKQSESMSHWHRISWWDHTNLGDVRATYKKDEIIISQMPIDDRFKIGIAHPCGAVLYVNDGLIFEKEYELYPQKLYPDGNVSFETFFCKQMAEIETLSPLYSLVPGDTVQHKEIWRIKRV